MNKIIFVHLTFFWENIKSDIFCVMAVQIFFDKLAVPIIFFFRRKIIMNVGISLNFDKNKIQVIPTCIFIKLRMLSISWISICIKCWQVSEGNDILVNGGMHCLVSSMKDRFSIPSITKSRGDSRTSTENFCLSGFTSNKSFSRTGKNWLPK